MRWIRLAAWLGLSLCLLAPGALAAGGPVPPLQGTSIGVVGSPFRYAAFPAGRSTVVKRLTSDGRQTGAALVVPGRYGVPGVGYSGGTTGLSADGRTLTLAELSGNVPPRTTRLLVLDTPRLAVRTRLTLHGFSTVDAISPDGRWLYLIHYPSSDISRYEVLAYDLVARRLLAKPIVDPHDRGEAMTGSPVTRVTSFDGRWAYTLYARPSGVPFVHALDTSLRRAVCIDLPSLSATDLGNVRLRLPPGGDTLTIDTGDGTPTLVDTRTYAVTGGPGQRAPAPARSRPHQVGGSHGGGGWPWELVVLPIAALALLGGATRRRRAPRTRPAGSRPAG